MIRKKRHNNVIEPTIKYVLVFERGLTSDILLQKLDFEMRCEQTFKLFLKYLNGKVHNEI